MIKISRYCNGVLVSSITLSHLNAIRKYSRKALECERRLINNYLSGGAGFKRLQIDSEGFTYSLEVIG